MAFVERMTWAGWAHATTHCRDASSQKNTRIAGRFATAAPLRGAQGACPGSSYRLAVATGRRRCCRGLSCCLRPRLGCRRPFDVGLLRGAAWSACVYRILWHPASARMYARLGIASSGARTGCQDPAKGATTAPVAAEKGRRNRPPRGDAIRRPGYRRRYRYGTPSQTDRHSLTQGHSNGGVCSRRGPPHNKQHTLRSAASGQRVQADGTLAFVNPCLIRYDQGRYRLSVTWTAHLGRAVNVRPWTFTALPDYVAVCVSPQPRLPSRVRRRGRLGTPT
jgi:hypothetical protein